MDTSMWKDARKLRYTSVAIFLCTWPDHVFFKVLVILINNSVYTFQLFQLYSLPFQLFLSHTKKE